MKPQYVISSHDGGLLYIMNPDGGIKVCSTWMALELPDFYNEGAFESMADVYEEIQKFRNIHLDTPVGILRFTLQS